MMIKVYGTQYQGKIWYITDFCTCYTTLIRYLRHYRFMLMYGTIKTKIPLFYINAQKLPCCVMISGFTSNIVGHGIERWSGQTKVYEIVITEQEQRIVCSV